jgi:DNA-binding CsgD family transcriptional regulator
MNEIDIKFLGDVSLGTHICLFYETQEDLLDTLVPYFKAGLENNEFCVWAISEPLTEEGVIAELRQRILAFDRFLENASIEIVPGREWYLEGDQVDLQKIVSGWNRKLHAALAKGYKAMRVSGNAFWLGTRHSTVFCDYERGLGESILGRPMSVLCTYPLAASTPGDILEVSHAHQFAIARRRGVWEFVNAVKAEALDHSLTPRELEVLTWVAKGKTAWEAATILHISKRTVDGHMQTIIQKLGAVNRTHAVAIALQSHLIRGS